jgi:long-subunit acyl-CoA synthetase (AMP-forming)
MHARTAGGNLYPGDVPQAGVAYSWRSKDMFISGGVNVRPAKIEAQLLKCPAVRDAVVIGVPHPQRGEVGVTLVNPATPRAALPKRSRVFLPTEPRSTTFRETSYSLLVSRARRTTKSRRQNCKEAFEHSARNDLPGTGGNPVDSTRMPTAGKTAKL